MEKMKTFLAMNMIGRRQALAAMIGSNGRYYFDGNIVCGTFLNKAFRFSRDVQRSVKLLSGTSHSSSLSVDNSKSNFLASAPSKEAIISFLNRLADSTGDTMPDCNERHLPFHVKDEVYKHFKEDFNRLNMTDTEPCQNYFYHVWKHFCMDIKVRRSTRFAKCDTCELLRAELKSRVTKFEDTSDLLSRKKAHYNFITEERMEYRRKRDIAALTPNTAWSVIIDGADQTSFGLPHFTTHTKSQRGHALKVKLVGILEHGTENKLRLLTMTEDQKTGANHIVEALHRFLMDRSVSSQVPSQLFIQVDNCTRENKNRYFLSYIESLVRWKVFKCVEVSFLPIGHTHEDVDQAFSATSNRLRRNDTITLDDLHEQLRAVYNRHTAVARMKYIINWSGLCRSEDALTNIKNFSHYRYFRFVKEPNHNQDVSCLVKPSVQDEWSTLPITFLKFPPDLTKTPPTAIDMSTETILERKNEITKRLETEEVRVRDPAKMSSLTTLRDTIFRSRKEKFHWNLQTCIELRFVSSAHASGSNSIANGSVANDHVFNENNNRVENEQVPLAVESSPLDEEDLISAQTFPVSSVEPSSSQAKTTGQYKYNVGSFVAVLCDSSDPQTSFWVGKILRVNTSSTGEIKTIHLHWYEPYRSGRNPVNLFLDKYAPSYLNRREPKERPWTNDIDPSSVLVNFDSLLQNRRLPSSVQKHLRTSISC